MASLISILLEILVQLKGLRTDLTTRSNQSAYPIPYIPTPVVLANRCHVCGIDLTGAVSYTCNYTQCPKGLGPVTSVGG